MTDSKRDPRLDPPADDELILDFLAGLLDPDERSKVLERAARDPGFEQRLRWFGAQQARAVTDPRAPRADSPSPRRVQRVLPFALATFLVGMGFLWWAGGFRSDPDSYWLPPLRERVVSRSTQVTPPGLEEALAAYAARDLETAVDRLESITAPAGWEEIRRIHLASARLNLGDPTGALEALAPVDLLAIPPPWREHVRRIRELAEGQARPTDRP